MADHRNVRFTPGLLAEFAEPPPRRLGPGREPVQRRRPRHAGALVVPPRLDMAQVRNVLELNLQDPGVGADVAGQRGHLLHLRDRNDLLAGLGGRLEGQVACLDRAPHRRRDEVGDLVMRRERLAQLGALLSAEGRQGRV